jgi:hypothetical protein
MGGRQPDDGDDGDQQDAERRGCEHPPAWSARSASLRVRRASGSGRHQGG